MKVMVGKGSCGIAAGASEVFDKLEAGLKNTKNCSLTVTGCIGLCFLEPIVNVENGSNKQIFVRVNSDGVKEILKYLKGEENDVKRFAIQQTDLNILQSQQRVALVNCGIINPESIDEYIAHQGYKAIEKCVKELTPEKVIEEIKISGLRDRKSVV